jgi:transcriptional regulator with GAF, ATPase, and Fis domain
MPFQTHKRNPSLLQPEARVPSILIVFSPDAAHLGAERPIGPSLTIGRTGGTDLGLAINDHEMSRRHTRLVTRDEQVVVEDLGSTNGTFINGIRVNRAEATAGSILRLGNTLIEVSEIETAEPPLPPREDDVVGNSPAFRAALREIDRVAATDLPVMLQGETGTGKEVFAARVHARSGRSGPLVTLNCSAIPRELLESMMFGHKKGAFTGAVSDAVGYFAQADRGTLFLDEIGDMPIELQPKLLRVLETGEFTPIGQPTAMKTEVRVISATNADLAQKMSSGGFRRDLYARLSGYVVSLPPLRERRSDIPMLCQRFLRLDGHDKPLTADFLEPLLLAPWPMNVRELRMVMKRAVLLAGGAELSGEHARKALGPQPAAAVAPNVPPVEIADVADIDAPEREQLVELLTKHGGNVSKLAAHFGRDRKQIYRWLRRWGIDADSFRPPQ